MSSRIPQLFLGLTAVLGLSTLLSTSCIEVEYPDIAFRCNPVKDGSDACPDGYQCCSDDPTAYDSGNQIASGVLPAYQNSPGGTGTPIFSANNNNLSSVGMCIRDGLLPPNVALTEPGAQGCPVPCNPRWSSGQIDSVCGGNSLCCQTVELDITDCVLDEAASCYRPVSGQDIQQSGIGRVDSKGAPAGGGVNWADGDHETMQDPNGTNCTAFAAGNTTARTQCIRALNVANTRGFCLPRSPTVTACPLTAPDYVDPCTQLNVQNGLSCG